MHAMCIWEKAQDVTGIPYFLAISRDSKAPGSPPPSEYMYQAEIVGGSVKDAKLLESRRVDHEPPVRKRHELSPGGGVPALSGAVGDRSHLEPEARIDRVEQR